MTIEIARDTDSAEVLTGLSYDRSPEVRRAVARNPNTPASILGHLAKDQDVWAMVARNANTPPGILGAILAQTESELSVLRFFLRANVAANPSIGLETVDLLSTDTELDVLWMLARNPAISEQVGNTLEQHPLMEEDWQEMRQARGM